jgi:hypothetical protein
MDAGGALNFISPQNALLVAQYPWLAFQNDAGMGGA